MIDHQERFNVPVVLVSDADRLLQEAANSGISTFRYRHQASGESHAESKRDEGFRSGFWLHTTRRFAALESYQKENDGPILHVESDVVILDRFNMESLNHCPTSIAYPLLSPSLGVGALVYLRRSSDSRKLATWMGAHGSSSIADNDMNRLAQVSRTRSSEVTILPTAPTMASMLFRESAEDDFRIRVSENSGIFGGIFDGATLGQYLSGLDPRNDLGRRWLSVAPSDHLIDPGGVTFEAEEGDLWILEPGVEDHTPILNLHIHSKDVRMFDASKRARLLARRASEAARPVRAEMDYWAFRQSVIERLRQKMDSMRKVTH
jgi:hypothetical protein